MKRYYFAYGSNMNQARLEDRIGKVKKIGVARMKGYRLVFNAGLDNRCFANVWKTGEDQDFVEGVIYEVNPRQLRLLDNFEGAPFLYNRVVEAFKGKNLYIYIAINALYCQQGLKKPEIEYLNHIIKGCKENNLLFTLKKVLEIAKK